VFPSSTLKSCVNGNITSLKRKRREYIYLTLDGFIQNPNYTFIAGLYYSLLVKLLKPLKGNEENYLRTINFNTDSQMGQNKLTFVH